MTIDWWTLGIQSVNILILIWLLQRFFWRPVAAMIEQRRKTTDDILAQAKATRAQAAAASTEIEQTRAGFAKERETILAKAHDDAELMQAEGLKKATAEAVTIRATARAEIAKEKGAAEKAWADQSSHLAIDIAGRLAGRLNGEAVRAAFLDWLLEGIAALPEATRAAVAADGATLDAISATPLDPADQKRYSGLIAKAFGAHPGVVFKVDPALIEGLELQGAHLTVNNSWRADLSRILQDIRHDNQS